MKWKKRRGRSICGGGDGDDKVEKVEEVEEYDEMVWIRDLTWDWYCLKFKAIY
jgi:hypothetical protein